MAKQAPYHRLAPLAELVNEQPELAIEALEALAHEYPSDSQVLYALGVAYLNLGEFDEAVRQLEAAAKREKRSGAEVYGALSRAYSYAGMPAHAHRAASKAGLNPPPWQEFFKGELPPGAKLSDLITFEEARRDLTRVELQAGPHTGSHTGSQALAALRQMQAFARKFPTYLPALNIIATGLFVQGKFSEAREHTGQVLATDPRNIHALLNLARIERLLGGVQAVGALRDRVEAARIHDDEDRPVMGGELALANLYLLMNDAGAAQAALDRFLAERSLKARAGANREGDEAEDDLDSPEAEQLQERLQRVKDHPHAPLMLPSELLPPGWFGRWRTLGSKAVRTIETDLRSIPGWFEQVEQGILFENGPLSGLLSAALIDPEVTMPDGVSSHERAERFRAMLQDGHGSLEGILGVAQSLQFFGLLPEDTVVRDPDGQEMQHLSLELVDEPIDSMNTRADLRQYDQAMNLLRSGQFAEAVAAYDALLAKYPDRPSLIFNRASALAQLGDEERAMQDLEQLRVTHPDYLFPPAQLAMKAIHDGDLPRARALLVLPSGLKRLHVLEYGYFIAVQAILALHEDKPEVAKRTVPLMRQLLEEGTMPLRLIRQEIKLYLRRHPEQAGELLGLLA